MALELYALDCPVNIRSTDKEGLINFPDEYMPQGDCFVFDISDGPNSINATYLIDYYEYDPEGSDIGFPANPKERLDVLLSVLVDMVRTTKSKKMIVAINECEQIEHIKTMRLSECCAVIRSDFEKYQAPPDTLYEIVA